MMALRKILILRCLAKRGLEGRTLGLPTVRLNVVSGAHSIKPGRKSLRIDG
jgi:hypothetical protein